MCAVLPGTLPIDHSHMSFSDFYPSDLSEITSSSEEDEPPATVKKPGRKPKADQQQPYTITQALRPPRSTSYSVRSLYGNPPISFSPYTLTHSFPEQIVDGGINLDPDYQRGAHSVPIVREKESYTRLDVVWAESKQIGLIDSVIRNYYIPPLIFGE